MENNLPRTFFVDSYAGTLDAVDSLINNPSQRKIISIQPPDYVTDSIQFIGMNVPVLFSELDLPTAVVAVFNDATQEAVPVEWIEGSYNGLLFGSVQVITGTISEQNPDSVQALIDVILFPDPPFFSFSIGDTFATPDIVWDDGGSNYEAEILSVVPQGNEAPQPDPSSFQSIYIQSPAGNTVAEDLFDEYNAVFTPWSTGQWAWFALRFKNGGYIGETFYVSSQVQ